MKILSQVFRMNADTMRDKSRQAAQNEYNRIVADAGEKSNRMIKDAEKL